MKSPNPTSPNFSKLLNLIEVCGPFKCCDWEMTGPLLCSKPLKNSAKLGEVIFPRPTFKTWLKTLYNGIMYNAI